MAKMLSMFLTASLLAPLVGAQTVRVGVFGLFHSHKLELSASPAEALVVSLGSNECVIGPGLATRVIRFEAKGNTVLAECGGELYRVQEVLAGARSGAAASLPLAVPGRMARTFQGTLRIRAAAGELVPTVTMDLETAVASAVQAESDADTPFEALKAQAVVSRSYFVAGAGRHQDFDFCDLTHCQFLREPPPAGSPALAATSATRGLMLLYSEKPFAAMFSRSCGGRTRTPSELGMTQGNYPYFPVKCDFCYRSPIHWQRSLPADDAALLVSKGEAGRLSVNRRLGWKTIPSNSYLAHQQGGNVILEGAGEGHGIGLCQRGAKSMAEAGANFREILAHYFPNTAVAATSHTNAR